MTDVMMDAMVDGRKRVGWCHLILMSKHCHQCAVLIRHDDGM